MWKVIVRTDCMSALRHPACNAHRLLIIHYTMFYYMLFSRRLQGFSFMLAGFVRKMLPGLHFCFQDQASGGL